MKSKKNLGRSLTSVLLSVMMIASVLVIVPSAVAQEYTLILDLTIDDTARVVDYDDGIYVVGTSTGDLYVINEAGDYTVTDLGAGSVNDVRIENGFIAVAAGTTVIELELDGLTPQELWRTTSSDWYKVVSTDLSEDGNYVTYMAQRYPSYVNSGEIGVLGGGAGGGTLISSVYTSGYRPTNWWLDATGDMEYIAASHPTYPPYYRVGVGLYHFDGSTLTFQWWTFLVAQYDVTEVRISENKDYVAAATSSGVYMDLLRLSDGAILWSHETPGKEQYACDGDDNLNYVIGANQAWSAPYGWFILKNLGESGYEVIAEGQMNGAINDIDSTPDCSYFAFGSDAGEVVLFKRTGDTVETVFTIDGLNLVDAIEIGSKTLLVGGNQFIHLYAYFIDIYVDIKPGSCPNPINRKSKGVLPVAICGTEDFDVTTIDPDTIQLTREGVEGYVEPLRWSYEDVATPYEGELCGCHDLNGDGYMDLTLKFENQEVVDVLELDLVAGETIPLIITGYLKEEYDGIPIEGQDCVWVLLSLDVGVTEIISPTSGTAQIFTAEVTVENFGTKKEKKVPVNMIIEKEGGIVEYDETVYINIDVGESMNVVFPDWTPDDWQVSGNVDIDYTVTACTMMNGDEDSSNDCQTETITLHYPYLHDVGVKSITEWPGDSSGDNINIWDLQFSFDLRAASGANGNAGAEFDGTYFYSTRWASNLIHQYDIDGNLVKEFSIPGVSGLRDLAYDPGTGYFYGGAAGGTIWEMDFDSETLIDSFSGGFQSRAIAYNDDDDVFYVSNWGDPVWVVDRTGAIVDQFNLGTTTSSTYGFAYDNTGPYLWVHDQTAGGSVIYQWDLTIGAFTGVQHDVAADFPTSNGIAGGLFFTTDFESGTATLGGLLQGTPDMMFAYGICETGGYPPGTYPIQCAIENYGIFTENNFNVHAGIWKHEPGLDDVLFWEDDFMVTTPLEVDGSAIINFNDVTFEDEDEGDYEIIITTELPEDTNPANDYLIESITVQY